MVEYNIFQGMLSMHIFHLFFFSITQEFIYKFKFFYKQ